MSAGRIESYSFDIKNLSEYFTCPKIVSISSVKEGAFENEYWRGS